MVFESVIKLFKKKSILTEEDNKELKELYRKHYLDESKKLISEQAKLKAIHDYGIKKKEEKW